MSEGHAAGNTEGKKKKSRREKVASEVTRADREPARQVVESGKASMQTKWVGFRQGRDWKRDRKGQSEGGRRGRETG